MFKASKTNKTTHTHQGKPKTEDTLAATMAPVSNGRIIVLHTPMLCCIYHGNRDKYAMDDTHYVSSYDIYVYAPKERTGCFLHMCSKSVGKKFLFRNRN